MHIMLTNDDGIFAAGIQALALELSENGGHQVTIVAPDSERSGAGHSFTFLTPLRANRVTLSGLEDVEAYAVNGTPTDCVKVGLGNLAQRPDCILSGINHGQNLGVDTTYSGTVSAAMEGALLGVPSMALSLAGSDMEDFGPAARIALTLLPDFLKSGSLLWNVNVPPVAEEKMLGVRYTPLAHQVYDGKYIERKDPHGRKYYWTPTGATYQCGPKEDCDVRWVEGGYVTITPLLTDFTDKRALAQLQVEG
ncbi:MAG: 5'/3'-nucleotidase SurE [Clostridia bacterium]|nr:5'/3'-nucleotidase SurE [Clostridia bacterium]